MGAHVGLPVRGVDDDDIKLLSGERLTQPLIAPAQLLPAAFGDGFVLRRILGVDQVRRVWRQRAHHDFALRHSAGISAGLISPGVLSYGSIRQMLVGSEKNSSE